MQPTSVRWSSRRRALLAVSIAFITGLAACGGGGTSGSSSARTYVAGGTLTIRGIGDFRLFDPMIAADNTTNLYMANSYATLLYLGADGKLVGYLAKSWKASATSVTFTLKSGITCADGTPVTPTVVKNSFQRMFDIKDAYNSILFGPGPYSTSADDAAGTFTFTVGTPYSDLLYSFSQTFPNSHTGIICPAGLKDTSQFPTKMFGAGPYTLVDAVHSDHVTFKLRSDFAWGPYGVTAKTVGMPDTLIYKIIGSETTAANALLTGAVDVAPVAGSDIDRLLNETTLIQARTLASYALRNLAFNESPGHIGTDQSIRQALITAVDPQGYLQGAYNGHGQTSSTFVAESVNCYDPSTQKMVPKPSITAARKILTDAGWTYGSNGKLSKNGQNLKFAYMGSAAEGAASEYLAGQWSQMGADVNLTIPDSTTYAQYLLASNFEVSTIGGVVPTPTIAAASKRISGPVPPKGTNYPQITDPLLDSEAAAAQQTTGADSCRHWANFQQELWKKWHLRPLAAAYAYTFSHNVDLSMAISTGSLTPMLVRRFK